MSESGCFELRINAAGEQMVVPLDLGRGAAAIGRDAGNTIHLNAENVSPVHARLTREERSVWVEDMQSATGLWINGERVSGRARIFADDVIRIGGFEMELSGESLGRRDDETTDRTLHPALAQTEPSSTGLSGKTQAAALLADETRFVVSETTAPESAPPEDTDPTAPGPPGFVRRESTEIVPIPGPDDFVPSERTEPAIRPQPSPAKPAPSGDLTEIVARPPDRRASEKTVIVSQMPELPSGRRLSKHQATRMKPARRWTRWFVLIVLLGGGVTAIVYRYRDSVDLSAFSFLLSLATEAQDILGPAPVDGPLAPAFAAARDGRWREAVEGATAVLTEDPDNSAAMDLALRGEIQLQAEEAIVAAKVGIVAHKWRDAIGILEEIDPSERTEGIKATIREARSGLAVDLLEQARMAASNGDAEAAEAALVQVDILGGPAEEVQAIRKQLDKKKRPLRKRRRRR